MNKYYGRTSEDDPTFRSAPRPAGEVIRRVVVYLLPYWPLAIATVGCAIVSLCFGLVYPKLTKFLIDDVIARQRHEALTPAALGLLGAFLLREVFNSLRIRVNNRLEQNVIFDMRRDVYARMQRLPLTWFDPRASGDLMTRIIEDVNNVERFLIDGTEQGTVAILSIVGALVFMFDYSPTLALVALIPMPLLVFGALWYTLTAHRRYRKQREAASAMNALLMDNLQGIRQIKCFGREQHEDTRFAERADALRKGTLVVMRAWAWYAPAMQFLGALGICLVLWIGGRLVLKGELDVGELVAFMLYAGMFFYEPIGRLHGLNQMLQSARAAAARVFDILDAEEELVVHQRAALRVEPRLKKNFEFPTNWRSNGDVEYRNVGFEYGPGKVALRDICFRVKPGEMVALVGPTGSGKSTLVSLLPAFYEVSQGAILVDGYDIRELPLPLLRAQISMVSQEPFLFNGTLRENIAFGRLDATEDEIIAAARAANCHDFIERLPDGYDSRVGERGVKLSVGEKQRVSIARALLKNAPILILDEATASVDTATEQLIQQAIERLLIGRTSIVIAHRLSTVVRANQILVMRHGRIVERGTHNELVEHGGLYAELVRIQNRLMVENNYEQLSMD